MAGGISNSLNMVFARINTIEDSFAQLQNISFQAQNSSIQQSNETAQSEFQKILENKIKENTINALSDDEETNKTGLFDELMFENDKIKEASDLKSKINLKSKIDLKAQSTDIDEIIDTFSQKYNVDGDLIKAIIKQESGFNPNAKSKKGAMGLMQLMPKTAQSLGVINAYNPWENVEGGVKYFKGLMDRFNNNEKLALAAYNAGPNAVKKYGGVPPYKETQNYVNSIMGTYNKVKGAKL